jgi:uncharacterized membrane protein
VGILATGQLLFASSTSNSWGDAAFSAAAFIVLIAIGVILRNPKWIIAGGAWALLGGVFAGLINHASRVTVAGVIGIVASLVAYNWERGLTDPHGDGPG